MSADPEDHERASDVASEAGRLLVELRAALERGGASPKEIRAAGDRQAHEFIVTALRESHPDDPVLSEEAADDAVDQRLASSRVWIVDPLDGTHEFGEPGRTDWAVHVALVIDSQPVAGAVALPALGRTLGTRPPPPPRPPWREGDEPRVVVSRSRPPAQVVSLQRELGATVFQHGSAGAKAMTVVEGDADIYVHTGGQYEWDSAAPVAVAAAAGLHVSRIDGSALVYNRRDVWLPDLLICRPELAKRTLAAWHSDQVS